MTDSEANEIGELMLEIVCKIEQAQRANGGSFARWMPRIWQAIASLTRTPHTWRPIGWCKPHNVNGCDCGVRTFYPSGSDQNARVDTRGEEE